jgi:prefoldin subunit 5
VPIRSANLEYDPWADVDGPTSGVPDGTINMRDVTYEIVRFNSFGTPIDRELINTTQMQIDGLNLKIDQLNATIVDLNSKISALEGNYSTLLDRLDAYDSMLNEMNATITQLQNSNAELYDLLDIMNATKMGKPDADSGWMNIPADMTHYLVYNHNLNTTEVLVYMIGKYSNTTSPYIHQYGFGADNYASGVFGAAWSDLTSTSIKLTRFNQDTNWVNIRVMLWKIPQ